MNKRFLKVARGDYRASPAPSSGETI